MEEKKSQAAADRARAAQERALEKAGGDIDAALVFLREEFVHDPSILEELIRPSFQLVADDCPELEGKALVAEAMRRLEIAVELRPRNRRLS